MAARHSLNMECEKIFLPFQRIPTFQSVSFFFALLLMTSELLIQGCIVCRAVFECGAVHFMPTDAPPLTHTVTGGGSVCAAPMQP